MDAFQILVNVLDTQRVGVHIMEKMMEAPSEFDGGLRGQLYVDYEYADFLGQMTKEIRDGNMSILTDSFDVNYILFRMPEHSGGQAVLIGPYVDKAVRRNMDKVAEDNQIPVYHITTLKHYYYGIPVIENMESLVYIFIEHIYGNIPCGVRRKRLKESDSPQMKDIQIEERDEIYIQMIERRYALETKLLEAVQEGNFTAASLCFGGFGGFQMPDRGFDNLREEKNWCLTLNVLYRKQVQKAKVHPVHIDEVSEIYAKRIENAQRGEELSRIIEEMLRKYCMLVQNHSLNGYSEMVEKAINYIDFHIQEPLGLQTIAEQLCLSTSYLSRLFKKETGKTITDYVNEKRIEKSLVLLTATSLPIREVAAKTGIFDENYFSRVFKKIMHVTPREYRGMIE